MSIPSTIYDNDGEEREYAGLFAAIDKNSKLKNVLQGYLSNLQTASIYRHLRTSRPSN
jgi:hypothetical protein